ncbi:hypothetical protein JOC77_000827 [Peribacillus deserti]|uniref:Uncharacterized protein n=1 Tax=Peribacillus deserti TaxID=673318 RepID=A0ABS2QEA4_9BACI|nr:hypothetical protein [Peribacillus deserti]MBM7691422.1 hypothetical protein [Peribacillus deserti]
MGDTNRKKGNHDPGTEGVEQPLMTTAGTDPGFDWDTDGNKLGAKPKIGGTAAGEKRPT